MDSLRFTPRQLAFLIGTPLAWAVLLLFHAGADPDDLYGDLRDEVTRWQVIAAAVAYRSVGAPLAAAVLLGLSAIAIVHAPPVGPVALVFFAAAVVLIARSRRPVRAADTPPPTPALRAGA